jgi:hypothetical protein
MDETQRKIRELERALKAVLPYAKIYPGPPDDFPEQNYGREQSRFERAIKMAERALNGKANG